MTAIPLDRHVREEWGKDALDILNHPKRGCERIAADGLAFTRLRYEATLQQKEALIQELVAALEGLVEERLSIEDMVPGSERRRHIEAAQETLAKVRGAEW